MTIKNIGKLTTVSNDMNAIPTLAIAKECGKRMWDLHPLRCSPLKETSVEGDEQEWLIAGWWSFSLTQARTRSCSCRAVHKFDSD